MNLYPVGGEDGYLTPAGLVVFGTIALLVAGLVVCVLVIAVLIKEKRKMTEPAFNKSGSKYLCDFAPYLVQGKGDVYAPILAFDVRCPARQHAIKKLLCSGIRGKGDVMQDLTEARDAIDRAIQIEEAKTAAQAKGYE